MGSKIDDKYCPKKKDDKFSIRVLIFVAYSKQISNPTS
jgi:hypothetical protein